MKSVLQSIQPYWVFLIVAQKMGWDIPKEKAIEVRKSYPTASDWDRKTIVYCTKDKQSFHRIPKQYQALMQPLLGKVVGEYACDKITNIFSESRFWLDENIVESSCLTCDEIREYAGGKERVYGWHISNLEIYNEPRVLSEFKGLCKYPTIDCGCCPYYNYTKMDCKKRVLQRPPQSWCYVEPMPSPKVS